MQMSMEIFYVHVITLFGKWTYCLQLVEPIRSLFWFSPCPLLESVAMPTADDMEMGYKNFQNIIRLKISDPDLSFMYWVKLLLHCVHTNFNTEEYSRLAVLVAMALADMSVSYFSWQDWYLLF